MIHVLYTCSVFVHSMQVFGDLLAQADWLQAVFLLLSGVPRRHCKCARSDFAACQRPLRSRKSIFRIGQRFCKISSPDAKQGSRSRHRPEDS